MSKMTEKEKFDLAFAVAKRMEEAAKEITDDVEIIITALAHSLGLAAANAESNKKEFISYVVHVIDEVYALAERRKCNEQDDA